MIFNQCLQESPVMLQHHGVKLLGENKNVLHHTAQTLVAQSSCPLDLRIPRNSSASDETGPQPLCPFLLLMFLLLLTFSTYKVSSSCTSLHLDTQFSVRHIQSEERGSGWSIKCSFSSIFILIGCDFVLNYLIGAGQPEGGCPSVRCRSPVQTAVANMAVSQIESKTDFIQGSALDSVF